MDVIPVTLFGTVKKPDDGELTVTFTKPFKRIPVVTLTPFWLNSRTQVGCVEAVITVSC
jgi:hypothetical protein